MTGSQATPIPAEPLRRISRLCAAAAIAIGVLVLAGWLFGVRALMQVLPGQVAMVPNTAVAFLLAGLALWLRASRAGRSPVLASRATAAVAGLLGLLNLGEYVSGKSPGLDERFHRPNGGDHGPGLCCARGCPGALGPSLGAVDERRAGPAPGRFRHGLSDRVRLWRAQPLLDRRLQGNGDPHGAGLPGPGGRRAPCACRRLVAASRQRHGWGRGGPADPSGRFVDAPPPRL